MASFEEIANMPDESVSEKGGSSNGGIVFAGTLHGQVLVCDELPDEVRPWYARKTTILLGFIALSIIAAFEVWHLLGYCTPLLLPKGIVFSFGASMLQFVFGLLWVICFALNAMRFVRFDMKVSSAFNFVVATYSPALFVGGLAAFSLLYLVRPVAALVFGAAVIVVAMLLYVGRIKEKSSDSVKALLEMGAMMGCTLLLALLLAV